ncbi:hypothetical protein O3M35_001999 [Rhynocoris fuscipes]|uniref:Rhabdoid tumor deletion region protein 1 n=1 Tax=Rhynocoris fuscipes TaxID=488301 RepID=A0AAW1CXE2_9HEMI
MNDHITTLSNRFHLSHRYLAQHPPTDQFSPAATERIVSKIFDRTAQDVLVPKPVSLVVAKQEPYIWAPWTDMSRAKKAFGNWCIPKLRRDLCSTHTMIVSQALCTLSDILHNPEVACEALSMNLHSRFVRLLSRDNRFVRQRTLLCIKIMATQPLGNVKLSQNKYILNGLKNALNDDSYIIKNQAIVALQAFLYNPFARETFVKHDFIKTVINCIQKYINDFDQEFYCESFIVILIECLNYLIRESDEAKIQAMSYGVFDLFKLLKHDDVTIRNEMALIYAELYKNNIGKLASHYWPFIDYIAETLQDKKYQECSSIVSTLRFAVVNPEARLRAIESGITEYLAKLVNETMDKENLMHLVQALICLAEHPEGRIRLKNIGADLIFSYTGKDTKLFQQILILFNTINKPL